MTRAVQPLAGVAPAVSRDTGAAGHTGLVGTRCGGILGECTQTTNANSDKAGESVAGCRLRHSGSGSPVNEGRGNAKCGLQLMSEDALSC